MAAPHLIDQDRFGLEGNCFGACVATLFRVALAEVMSWYRADDKHAGQYVSGAMGRWLARRGLIYVEVPRGNLTSNATDEPKREQRALGWSPLFSCDEKPYVILCGPSPRHEGLAHCVLGRTNGYFVETVHDPHPDRAGLPDVTNIGFFVALNAGVAARPAEIENERDRYRAALNTIAFEPLGDPEASDTQVLSDCVGLARRVLGTAARRAHDRITLGEIDPDA